MPGAGGAPPVCVVLGFCRLLLRPRKKPRVTRPAMKPTPNGTPTPMPIFAPVERPPPLLLLSELADPPEDLVAVPREGLVVVATPVADAIVLLSKPLSGNPVASI